ncbi:hypothetical protein MKQ68_00380 [Chitinophaga horti]|uniref:Uncharacterized protein n=1 Tax=Chitinophaga horti TaxID=2920382 RepID=A0ABY6J2C1_9BACT|nr:hypothetical protein [Chitinophaga horti]UYQ93556.1 hypothetical protein MKQ68_00380 [Chitinophaga horti]
MKHLTFPFLMSNTINFLLVFGRRGPELWSDGPVLSMWLWSFGTGLAIYVIVAYLFALASFQMKMRQRIAWMLAALALPFAINAFTYFTMVTSDDAVMIGASDNRLTSLLATVVYAIITAAAYKKEERSLPDEADELINSINVND